MRWQLSFVGCSLLLTVATSVAQPPPGSAWPTPRLASLLPAGGKQGTSVEVTFSGTFVGAQGLTVDMEEAQTILFDHPGLKAEPIMPPPPPPPDPKNPPKTPPVPASVTKFKVTIAPDVPLGLHEARLVNKWGVSNPRAFYVGDLPEAQEKEPNNDVPEAMKIDLNSTVNGGMAAPTDVDYFSFTGKKGQRVVLSCLTSSVDSRMDPVIEVYSSAGRQLAMGRLYNANDALTSVTLPEDGDYLVRLYQFTHTVGNAEYFYRLSVGTMPWIDAVVPLCVEPGKATQVTVYGRNLPGGKPEPTVVVDGQVLEKLTVSVTPPAELTNSKGLAFSGLLQPPSATVSGFEYRVKNASGSSNPVLISVAAAPVTLDNEKNEKQETAQAVKLPTEIVGTIEKRRDRDWYSFEAKKGEVLSIELLSNRLGLATDMKFMVVNPANKNQVLFESPENVEIFTNHFYARSSDPAPYKFTVPSDGTFLVGVKSLIGDLQTGPRQAYRLRITPEQQDFRLVAMPASLNNPDSCVVQKGGSQYINVFAWRQDGFNGDIQISAEGLPVGVTCPTQTLSSGMRHVTLVFSAAAGAAPSAGLFKIKGTANIQGKPVVREARGASITWPVQAQQNIPTISRLHTSHALAVRDTPPFALTATIDKAVLQQGDKASIAVKLSRLAPDLKVQIALQTTDVVAPLPAMPITLNNGQPLNIAADKNEGTVPVEVKAAVPPGVYNVVLRGQAQVPFAKDPAAKTKPNLNVILPSTPITITVLPKTVGTLSLSTASPAVKVGMETEVMVKIVRQFDYAGELKVQVVIPPAVKGITVADAVIPAGKDEAKLVIKAAGDAVPGNRPDLLVRATATLQNNLTAVQEVKFAVNVQK